MLKSRLSLMDFFSAIDGNSKKLTELRKECLFCQLEEFYKSVKNFKNRFTGGKYYLDEGKFIRLYNKYNPDKSLKIGYQGQFRK